MGHLVRWTAFAVAALVGVVALGYGAASLMESSSPANDACIGCGLVIILSIAVGVALAGTILGVGWTRRPRPTVQ